MFIGHFALGFAAKRFTPNISLAVLFAAAQFADLLWPFLVASGLEQVRIDPGNTAFTPLDFVSYPYSHSLLLLVIWGTAFGLVYRSASGRNGRSVLVLGALVVSHWVLDFATHRPDLPLYPGGVRLGLGLWNSVAATLTIEIVLFAFGLWVYARATRPRDKTGRWAFAGLALFLLVAYLGNIGTVPPSVPAIYLLAIPASALLLWWSWWADRHRQPRAA